jgi:hypothetical protein
VYSNPLFLALTATSGIVLPFRPSTTGGGGGGPGVTFEEVTTLQRLALVAVSGKAVVDTDLQKVFRKSGTIWVEI